MPDYIVKIKSPDTLTQFELEMLEARVKNFFVDYEWVQDDTAPTTVKAEYV